MSLRSRPLWFEGQLVRPQHLQQQQRWLEAQIDDRLRAVGPYGWGIGSLVLDASLLGLGKIGIESCRAIMPDGLPLDIPGRDGGLQPLQVPPGATGALVKLAVPIRHGDALEVDAPSARYQRAEQDVRNATGPGEPARIVLGRPQLTLLIEGSDEAELATLPIARVARVTPSGEVILDTNFVPPSLCLGAHPRLIGFAKEIEGMLRGRADALSARVDPGRTDANTGGLVDFALLQLLNTSEPVFAAMGRTPSLPPHELHRETLRLAGALSTFSRRNRRVPELPDWSHTDPASSLTGLMAAVREALATLSVESAIALPLQSRGPGLWISPISDRSLLGGAIFVLAVSAAVDPERIRATLPAQAKMGPAEAIRDLVGLQLPGIPLRPMPVAPRDVPYRAGTVYFELDQKAEIWRQLETSPAFVLHIGAEIPALVLEFWAIRQG